MNRHFRTISAFMRSAWAIEPVFAEQHLPYVQSYLAGTLPLKHLISEEDDEEDQADPVASCGYALAGPTSGSPATQTRYALDDPELPEGSVFVLNIRGAIFKESTCCSVGTEDYCRLINQAYANEKIIGVVCLIDSPGGQLSGTPTLYDAIRDPQKPTVSVIDEGLMASAAYWLASGSDDIYATQKSDQVGSIGVFVQFNDTTEQKAKLGIKTHTVYSDRSAQKNKPFRDALAGDDSLLREDLNQAADLFREAVETGRGSRLKPGKKGSADDVFEGGLFYASKAITLGLIDGFGNLATAVSRVTELHQARQQGKSVSTPVVLGAQEAPIDSPTTTLDAPLVASSPAPIASNNPSPELAPTANPETASATELAPNPADQSQTPNPTQPMPLFGYTKLPALAAVKGVAATDVTEAQITAINTELSAEGYAVAVISESEFASIQTLQTQLTTAQNKIAELGKQPGVMGTKVQKETEPTAGSEPQDNSFFSETDALAAKQKAGLKR